MKALYVILIISLVAVECKKNDGSYDQYVPTPNNNQNVGASAKDFLRSTIYKSLKIEIQYMPGSQPGQGAVDLFVNLLNERLNKPAGVFVLLKEINPTLKTMFSLEDILDIESLNRTVYTNGDQMSAYIILIDGSYYSGNSLAIAYRNTSICIFGEQLKYFSGGMTVDAKTKVMAMLFMHEFGHLFGLVDLATPMIVDHEDKANPDHCINNSCLMHHTYAANNRLPTGDLSEIPSLDTDCIRDLRGNGGK